MAKIKWTQEDLEKLVQMRMEGHTWKQLEKYFNASANAMRKVYNRNKDMDITEKKRPRILLLDIETKPLTSFVWQLWDNNVALNQIKEDWSILSWSAKWLGEDEVFYQDNRHSKNLEDDKELLKDLWKLIDESDILVGHNIRKFDDKRISARFIANGFKSPSSYRMEDTMILAKARFGFTSNKLEYLTGKLCKKFKKLDHAKFPGFKLWDECMKGNVEAWDEMQAYNQRDVESLEELYLILKPWDKKGYNVNVFNESEEISCTCGSVEFSKNGFVYSNTGKFQRYTCKKCGAETKSKENLLSKEKRKSLKSN
jgi:hypothetical protein